MPKSWLREEAKRVYERLVPSQEQKYSARLAERKKDQEAVYGALRDRPATRIDTFCEIRLSAEEGVEPGSQPIGEVAVKPVPS